MNHTDIFQQEMQRAEQFFKSNKKNDNFYFRLYASKTPGSLPNQKYLKASNFESESLEESLEMLQTQLELQGPTAQPFWILKLMSGQTDSNGPTIALKNALYINHAYRPNSTIAGIGSTQNQQSMDAALVQMQKEWMEKHHELQMQLREKEHERDIERLEERIAGIESSNKTLVDTITGFAESETGKMIVSGLIGMITAKMAQPTMPVQNVQPQAQNVKPQAGESQQDIKPNDVPQGVNTSLSEMQQMFGDDYPEVLKGIADYCKANPQLAKQLMQQQKQASNEQ